MNTWTIALIVAIAGPLLMIAGLVWSLTSQLRWRRSSTVAMRLLLLGPGIGLIGGALLAIQLPVDLAIRVLVAATSLTLAAVSGAAARGVRGPST